jgi:glycine/serine hydroxymethyltransferase
VEIDAVVLSGRSRKPVAVGECKWARRVDGRRLSQALAEKAGALGVADAASLRRIVAARSRVDDAPSGVLTVTAADIFPDPA